MSLRLKSLVFAFCLSATMWVAIVMAITAIYHSATVDADALVTASTR